MEDELSETQNLFFSSLNLYNCCRSFASLYFYLTAQEAFYEDMLSIEGAGAVEGIAFV
jgi:hypothetical protein